MIEKQIRKALSKIRQPLERFLLNFPRLNYYLKENLGRPDLIELAIALYLRETLKKNAKPFFIQIGANNGVTNDFFHKFIKKYNLSGILVEPVPHLFEQLKKNYGPRKGLYFENAAIGNPQDHLTFYRVKSDRHKFYDQLGSFNKATILNHKKKIPNIEALIVEEQVRVVDFNVLVQNFEKKKIDILIMDTEGYDGEIIKMINFDKINIDLLVFENKHLSVSDHQHCINLLTERRFKAIVNGSDTICLKRELFDILSLPETQKVESNERKE
jgi:FkbM family methyltransferase